MPEEQKLNYLEIGSIPPLPLFALFAADDDGFGETENKTEDKSKKDTPKEGLFGPARAAATDTLLSDDFDRQLQMGFEVEDEEETGRKRVLAEQAKQRAKAEFKKSLLSEVCSADLAVHFDSRVCSLLTEYLAYVQLDGITALDQIHLIALADTAANIRCDVTFGGRQDVFGKRKNFLSSSQQSTDLLGNQETDNFGHQAQPTVDTCGFKFLLALRSYNYLLRTLPAHDSQLLKQAGLGSAVFTWAFHSECQQELLTAITQANGPKPIMPG